MIAYLKHGQIDMTRWDECIAHAVNGNVYAWSWYLDVVHPGWEALVEMDDDIYLSVMPLTGKKKCFIHYLCQPFFAQQLGVFSLKPVTPEKTMAFLQAIPPKYRLVEIRLNEGNPLPEGAKWIHQHRNYLLDLNRDYDYLFSHYHENTKRNLKKSLNNGLLFDSSVSIESVIALFRENRGATIQHWGDAEYERLHRLAQLALSSSNAFVYGVKTSDNESVICGALFMVSHHRITFLFSGNNALGRERHAMPFLIDRVIRQYAGQPWVLDFEGSDEESLARFYQGFGSVPVQYPDYMLPLFKKR